MRLNAPGQRREGGALRMRLTGRPGTKDFIRADAGPWLRP